MVKPMLYYVHTLRKLTMITIPPEAIDAQEYQEWIAENELRDMADWLAEQDAAAYGEL